MTHRRVAAAAVIGRMADADLPGRFFGENGASYDTVVQWSTLGLDAWWKRRMLRLIPPRPTALLDQACGTGILTLRLARKFPGCRIVGVDCSAPYLRIAQRKSLAAGHRRIYFLLGRAEEVRLKENFDAVMSSYLAKYARLPELIANSAAMLRRDGVLVLHDFTYPRQRRIAAAWELYFKMLLLAGAPMFPAWRHVFYELPVLLRRTAWVPRTLRLLESAGFRRIRVAYHTLGACAIVSAIKG